MCIIQTVRGLNQRVCWFALLLLTLAASPSVGQIRNIRLGSDPAALPSNQRSQAEPHIVRSPTDPNFLVGVFHEGDYALHGGALDCGYSVSHDGGNTWSRALIPSLTKVVSGVYSRASDPTVAIDLRGNVYLNTIVATGTDFDTGPRRLVISKSADGGATFGAPIVAYQQSASSSIAPDKNWLVANTFSGTTKANRLLMTFTQVGSSSAPIARIYSDDAGSTWSSPLNIGTTSAFCDGSRPLYLANGKTVVIYQNEGTDPNSFRLEIVASTDGGTTFGSPTLITKPALYQLSNVRSQKGNPGAAADRTTGSLYVVYQSNGPKIFFTKSTDSGAHWSTPVAISDNPSGSPVFNPAIAVSPDGKIVTVVFYDQRNDSSASRFVDLYAAQSTDGGATWQPNFRVSSVSSDYTVTPFTEGGYLLGDYLAVAEAISPSTPAVPIWADTRNGDADPYVALIPVPTGTPTPTPIATATPTATPSSTPTPTPASGNILINGGFESNYTGWTATGNQNIYTSSFAPTTEGVQGVQFNGAQKTPNGVLTQTFNTVPGTIYTVSFDLGVYSWQNTAQQTARVSVTGNGSLFSQDFTIAGLGGSGVATAFSHKSFNFTANTNTTTLTFTDVSAATTNIDWLLDNVQVVAISTPSPTPTPTSTPTATPTPTARAAPKWASA